MKNFANKLNARLFNVKFGVNKNYICSGIEAESLDEAKAKAEAIAKAKNISINKALREV